MKPDGPWVLLPSKQYPDEVYYFNVLTGASTWEKPQNYCEPVHDSCTTVSGNPENIEPCSYIVESLSPTSSPRKHVSQNKSGEEENKNKNQNHVFRLSRERNKISDHPYKYVGRTGLSKDDDFTRCPYNNERVTDVSCMVQKHIEPTSKNANVKASSNTDSVTLEMKRAGSSEPKLNLSNSKTRNGPGKSIDRNRDRKTFKPTFFNNRDELRTELKTSKFPSSDSFKWDTKPPLVSGVFGSASLRLERLKKQLAEDRLKKNQQPFTAYPESLSGMKCQTPISLKWSRPYSESRQNCSLNTILDSRADYSLSTENELSRIRTRDNIPKSFSPFDRPNCSHSRDVGQDCGKPYFIADYFHSKQCNKITIYKTNYFDSLSNVSDDELQKLCDPNKKSAPKLSQSNLPRNFDRRTTNPRDIEGYNRNMIPYKEHRTKFIEKDTGYAAFPFSNKSFKSSFLLTQANDRVVINRSIAANPNKNASYLLREGICLLDSGKRLFSETLPPHVSKSIILDRSLPYKSVLLEPNTQRNPQAWDKSDLSNLKFSSIGSLASATGQLFSGKPNMTMSKKSESYDVSKNLSRNSAEYLNVPSNCNESLRKSLQTSGRDCENKETVKISWEHHPKRLVRDYNHKRLSSSFVEKSSLLNHVNTSEPSKKHTKSSLDCEAPVQRKTGLSNSSDKSDISVLFKRRSNHEREFLSSDESGNQGRKESLSSSFRTSSEKFENVAKGICRKDSQDHLVTTKQGNNSCYNISSPPKALKVSRSSETGNPRFFENLPEKVQKQKYHNSKGGITKINRRVQKQIRIVAPKYMQLTSDLQKRHCDLPEKNYSARETLKSPSIPESDQGEEMDWEPIEPERVVLHVEELRREGALQNYINPELINLCNNDSKMSSQWFIVLDTNIFISNLEFLKELRDMKDKELGMPSLIVPWVVLQELDNLKSSTRKVVLQLYARKAIQFLHDNLSLKHPRIRGQPKAEAEKHSDLQADDSILQCSLDLQKQSSKVLLLTNDRNLFNKAVINGLECCSAAKLLQELENRNIVSAPSTFEGETKHSLYSIVQTLKQCIGHVLEEVLRTEMVIAYDRQWSEIIARKPPWSLNDILFCILKHWVAVFNSALPAAARELIEKLRSFVNNEVYEYSSENVENILKTCISLVHLVSSLAYKQYVDEALKTLCELQCVLNEQKKSHADDSLSTLDSTSSKLDDTPSATSNASHSSVSSSRVLEMKGEQHSHIGSGLHSNEDCDGSICCGGVGGAKCDDDDCLSLFASSFSEDTTINQEAQDRIKAGQELAHKCLNTIWEEVVVYCGILCDMMGINPCVDYRRPDPFPSLEKLKQNLLNYISCVRSLLRCMDGILAKQPDELQENSPVLSNFYTTIKDFLPVGNNLGEILLPEHLLVYCTQNTRQQLECGKKQFEQFEAVLNRALKFFLVPNQDNL